jgi:hypothetical protein
MVVRVPSAGNFSMAIGGPGPTYPIGGVMTSPLLRRELRDLEAVNAINAKRHRELKRECRPIGKCWYKDEDRGMRNFPDLHILYSLYYTAPPLSQTQPQ